MEIYGENTALPKLIAELKKMLESEKNPAIWFPKGVESVLDEINSQWAFTYDFVNTTNSARDIALFTAGINTGRLETVDALNEVPGIAGGKLKTTYAAGKIILLNDDPRILNLQSGEPVDCVATQEHKNSAGTNITQDIYADGVGKITVTSSRGSLDFLRKFAEIAPLRLFEIKITTDTPETMFNGIIKIKEINPFENQLATEIALSKYVTMQNTLATMLDVAFRTYIGANTFMSFTLPKASRTSITLRLSAVWSQLHAIRNTLKTESFLASLSNAAGTMKSSSTSESSASSLTNIKTK